MANLLDLSAEQEQQISGIVNASELAMAVDRERVRQIRDEFRSLAENFDEGAAQGLADELGQITARLAYSHVSTMAQVRAVFTEEQRAQLDEYRGRRQDFREQYGNHHWGRFGGE